MTRRPLEQTPIAVILAVIAAGQAVAIIAIWIAVASIAGAIR